MYYNNNLLRLLTQEDLTDINNYIDEVSNSKSTVRYGTATLRYNQNTALNFTTSKYIAIYLNGYIQAATANTRKDYFDINCTILHLLGNSHTYEGIILHNRTVIGSENEHYIPVDFKIQSSTNSNIIYSLNLPNMSYSSNNMKINYLLFT